MTTTIERATQPGDAATPPAAPDVRYVEVSGFDHLSRMGRPTNRQIFGHVLLTAVLAVVGGQLGWFGSQLLTERYEALSEIEYRGSSWTETQDVTIRSRTLVEPVAESFGIEIKKFEERLGAGLVPGTQLLRITYEDADPDLALDVVSTLTDRYLDEAAELPPPESREALEASLAELRQQQEEAQDALLAIPDDGIPGTTIEQQELQSEIASLRARIGVLELRLLDSGLAELDTVTSGVPRVVTEPFVFEEPVFPRERLLAAIGFVAGGALGLLLLAIHWNRIAWATNRI